MHVHVHVHVHVHECGLRYTVQDWVESRLGACAVLDGMQVTAVSSKTNTTAAARLGAFTEGAAQVALYDTPGVVSTRYVAVMVSISNMGGMS